MMGNKVKEKERHGEQNLMGEFSTLFGVKGEWGDRRMDAFELGFDSL